MLNNLFLFETDRLDSQRSIHPSSSQIFTSTPKKKTPHDESFSSFLSELQKSKKIMGDQRSEFPQVITLKKTPLMPLKYFETKIGSKCSH